MSLAMLLACATVPAAAAQEDGALRARIVRASKALVLDWQRFTLPNGLRVVVHTDRSVPTVTVSTFYGVGSRDEPPGRTGLAHLFEHLMFNGSANAPRGYTPYTDAIGARVNAITDKDLTRYSTDVLPAGLDRVLFLESDRMAYLAGTLTPTALAKERGIVENEQRTGAGSAQEAIDARATAALYPGHGYGHPIGGSMADLRAVTPAEAAAFYRAHYGPGNAVLALVGNIDLATAKRLVTRYFGDLPPGPPPRPAPAVPTLSARIDATMTAPVPAVELRRYWAVPGDADTGATPALIAGTRALSLPDASPTRILVRDERLFSDVSVTMMRHAAAAELAVTATVRDGVDPKAAAARLDTVMMQAFRTGPTQAELDRVGLRALNDELRGLRPVGARGLSLARGLILSDDPDADLRRARAVAAQTPAQVRAAFATWVAGRPPVALTITPGPADATARWTPGDRDARPPVSASVTPPTRPVRPMPPLRTAADTIFPPVLNARLANGMPLDYIHQPATSFTDIRLSFPGGAAADPPGQAGLHALLAALVGHGTQALDQAAFEARLDLLGASFSAGTSDTRTAFDFSLPSSAFAEGAPLFAAMMRTPRWTEDDLAVARARVGDGAGSPQQAIARLVRPVPAAEQVPPPAALEEPALGRALAGAFAPGTARLSVVSDLPLETVTRELDRAFADWRNDPAAKAAMPPSPSAPAAPGIYVLPGDAGPLGAVVGAVPLSANDADPLATAVAIAILGEQRGRLNTNLRERHQWTYGAFARRDGGADAPFLLIDTAGVQRDRLGAALAEMRRELTDITGKRPVSETEVRAAADLLARQAGETVDGSLGTFDAIEAAARLAPATTPVPPPEASYRAVTRARVQAALVRMLRPDTAIWVVAGDAAAIRRQLDGAGLPIRDLPAAP